MFNFEIIDKVINIQISFSTISNALIYLSGLLWGIELIPQVIKTVKSKNVEGISTAFFAICLAAYIIYMFANGLVGNWPIVIAHIPSLTLLMVMLILIVRYRKNGKKKCKIK